MITLQRVMSALLFSGLVLSGCGTAAEKNEKVMEAKPVTIMNLDPGHFHAALVQKNMYDGVSPTVYVYAPDGPEVGNYLSAIESYNTRQENPTTWEEKVYRGNDFFEKMIEEKPGNVMVVSGNNAKKTAYLNRAIKGGINVLADKPMVIVPAEFPLLLQTFKLAEEKGLLLYDIMTERFEVTTGLQRALSQESALFGSLLPGTPDDPSITKESVHHYSKLVSGKPIKRPAWFFDVAQQGEGIVDVTTHLVDLVFWECYPEQIIDHTKDIEVAKARRWSTELNAAQFEKVTQLKSYPDYLEQYVDDGILKVYANGEIVFKVKDVYAKVSVIWNFEAPAGTQDTHYSIMKGSKANLIIRQGADEGFKPILYVEPVGAKDEISDQLIASIAKFGEEFPGLSVTEVEKGWKVNIPDEFKLGHEAHFAQVTEQFLKYLKGGKLPDWEVPNMISKYFVTTEGYRLSR